MRWSNHKFGSLIKVASLFCFSQILLPSASAQKKDIDQHILAITNKQLVGYCQRFWRIDLVSKSADTLILEASKLPVSERLMITKKIIPLLTDSCQGIALHYVLSAIWKKSYSITSGVDPAHSEVIEYTYDGLKFYQSGNRKFTDFLNLQVNQTRWMAYISK